MSATRTILVFGSTGNQGGGLIKALIALNSPIPKYKIRAVTRDATSQAAKALGKSPNVQVVQGDLSDAEKLFEYPEQVYGVFLLPLGMSPQITQQSIDLADISVAKGVKHFIYSGVDLSGTDDTVKSAFDFVRPIRAHIKTLPIRWTILAPTGFMENFCTPLQRAAIPSTWNPKNLQKYVATSDIGRAAAQCFDRPEEFGAKEINLAGDALTSAQTIKVWLDVVGKSWITSEEDRAENLRPGVVAMNKWLWDYPMIADPSECRRLFGSMKSLKDWLETEYKP